MLRNKQKIGSLVLLFVACLFPSLLWAAGAQVGFGTAASNVSEVLKGISGIIEAVLYIAACVLFISAAMKYRIHRQNPQQVPIATPITEVVLAVVLACLPMVTRYANDHLFEEDAPAPPARVQQHMLPPIRR